MCNTKAQNLENTKAGGYKDFVSAGAPFIGFNAGSFDVAYLISVSEDTLEVRYSDELGQDKNVIYNLTRRL